MSYIEEGDTHFCIYSSWEEDAITFFHEACERYARLFMSYPEFVVANALRRTTLPAEQWQTFIKDNLIPINLVSPGDEAIAPLIGPDVEIPFSMAICIGPHHPVVSTDKKEEEHEQS